MFCDYKGCEYCMAYDKCLCDGACDQCGSYLEDLVRQGKEEYYRSYIQYINEYRDLSFDLSC